ncbi:MAG TPA: PAS domain S-box protein [Labilithrix sp.]|nr:PAS domain S-box protein [Labilithrix sp.]
MAQAKLARSEHLLRGVFEGALDAMLLANDRGEYVDANPAACELFGLPLEQLVGRSVGQFAAPGYDIDAATRAFLEHGKLLGRFPLQRPDGSQRVLEFRAVMNVAPGLHLSILRDVTEQTRAEESLRRSEARLRAVIEKSTEAFSLTAADGTTEYLTRSAGQWLGWPEEVETTGRSIREHLVPEDRLRMASSVDRFVRSGERDETLTFRVRHGDGSIRWIETTATNLLDDPDVRAIVCNHRDITERKLAEDKVGEGRRLLEEAQAIAHVGSWSSGVGVKAELSWSPECYRIFGLPQGTPMTVESFMGGVHPADREAVAHASHAATAHNASYDIEHRVQWPDGQLRWVRERAVVERDAAGRATRMIGTVADITDQRTADQGLRASEERYRRIVESTSEGVWMYDGEGVTTFMNGPMAEMLGYTVEEAAGKPINAFTDDAIAAQAETPVEGRRGREGRHDVRLRRKDGSMLWASMQANALFGAGGRFDGGVALLTDVSAQRIADEARAHLAAIVESSEDAILSTSLSGEIKTWNRGAEQLFQYSAAEVVGQNVAMFTPAGAADEEARRVSESLARGEPVQHYETQRRRRDGSLVDVALTTSPIRDSDGTMIGRAKTARDLTASRRAAAALRSTEEQFRQAQKMEAVGRLAGGVAHDFNNLLSVVLSYSSLAVADLKQGDPLRDDMREIQAAGERGTALTRQLLAFSRQQVLQPRVIDVSEIVDGMRSMLGRLLGEDVDLSVVRGSDIGRVHADPGQIEQVVMNLAVNARDAMPDGGSLTISLANVELDGASSAPEGAAPGPYVSVTVRDNGTGMDAATRARIFEPFFTTKEPGKGTGLGLATVFGIMNQSGGYVGVESSPGQGSAFTVYLPRTDQAVDAPSSAGVPLLRRGTETILLVEDESEVRAVARIILRRQGYEVLEAANGGEAFLIAQDYSPPIHLLLTDVVMPRMSGRKLAEQLALQRPEMKLLFVSGYTDDAIVRHGVLEAGVAFLQKPFSPDSLLRKVRDVLDAPRGTEAGRS